MGDEYVAFNGFDLSTVSPYLEFDRRNPNDAPKRDVVLEPLARGQGSKVLGAYFRERIIPITGHVNAPDRASADVVRDALMAHLQSTQANLDLWQAGALRTYKATLSNIIWTNIEAGLVIFELDFTASDPLGYDTSSTTIAFGAAKTTQPADISVSFGGSYFQEPIIAIALSSGTGLTGKTISITNPDTGETISVTRNWSALDTLVIDVPNRAVTVNGAVVDYVGVFPRWFSGTGRTVRYADNFTTRSVTLTGSYVKRYL